MRYQQGEWAFEVTEEVGHVIAQPCVFVRAQGTHVRVAFESVCGDVHAPLSRNSFLM